MNTEKQHIKLAEFCERDPGMYAPNYDIPIFDPRNSADDCEALMRKLESSGIRVQIEWGLDADEVIMRRKPADPDFLRWQGDNYKHGVCDLAEKIIEQQEDGDD